MTVRIDRVGAAHPEAVRLLARYFEELRARLGEFDERRTVSAAPEEVEPPHGAFLVLWEDGVAVACGGAKTHAPGTGEIKRMFVAPEARGRGYGRRMLHALEGQAGAFGWRHLVLDTAAPLAEARALYEASGYRAVPPFNDNPYAAHWYAKDLPPAAADAGELRAAAERWMAELWGARRLAAVDELHAEHFVDHSPAGRAADRAAYRAGVAELFAAFPDFSAATEDLVVDAATSRVAVRWSAAGTHHGLFLGCAPTGRRVDFRGIEVLAFEGGRIVARWGEWDGLDLLRQLSAARS